MKKYSELYIAEKPDIGRTLATYLWPNGASKQKGYIEKGNVCVTWAFGHILTLAEPVAYDEKYREWRNYPIIPQRWKLHPAEGCREQLAVIKKLLQETDCVIHAGDPDREGQLLIDEILLYFGYKGPVKRLLINAKDDASLKRALANIEDNAKYRPLYEAGLARERIDWLIGMNLTRAYTVQARNYGYTDTFRIGRVKMPTLALVVQREKEIKAFKSVQYYELLGHFKKDNASFTAKWKPNDDLLDANGHIKDEPILRAIQQKIEHGKAVIQQAEYKDVKESPPLPYSLDTLQTEANKELGLSPKAVLDTVQALYEKKLVSYPRSDCNYLPSSQQEDAKDILPMLAELQTAGADAADSSQKGRAFNDKKITAHHAIIPTQVQPKGLSDDEQNIYDMIARRYVLQFLPVFAYRQVKFILVIEREVFEGSGKLVQDAGYRAFIKGKEEKHEPEENASLPILEQGDHVEVCSFETTAKKTTPPKRFTEGTLLAAMTNIWRYMDKNNPNREKLKEIKGIGTPATRDTIIAELLTDRLKGKTTKAALCKKGKELMPTDFGKMIIEHIAEELTMPDSTAEMEYRLSEIAAGNMPMKQYLNEFITDLTALIAVASQHKFPVQQDDENPLCPVCQKGRLVRRYSRKSSKYFHICSDPECVAPTSKRRLFYDDKDGQPLIAKCPSCGEVLVHFIKPERVFWLCEKCDRFYKDVDGRPFVAERMKGRERTCQR